MDTFFEVGSPFIILKIADEINTEIIAQAENWRQNRLVLTSATFPAHEIKRIELHMRFCVILTHPFRVQMREFWSTQHSSLCVMIPYPFYCKYAIPSLFSMVNFSIIRRTRMAEYTRGFFFCEMNFMCRDMFRKFRYTIDTYLTHELSPACWVLDHLSTCVISTRIALPRYIGPLYTLNVLSLFVW